MTPRTAPQHSLPLWAACLAAVAGGILLDAAFPDRDVWALAVPSILVALVIAKGRRLGGAMLVGSLFGWSFYGVHIHWATEFLGVVPWMALTTLMSLWWGGGTVLIALAYRWIPRVWPGILARLLFLPAVVAGLWTLREGVASVWPYGGFAWGRVALSQSESPIAGLFSLVGVAGVSFLLVWLAAVALEAIEEVRVSRLVRATLVAAVATGLVAAPAWPIAIEGGLRVAAVQGNAKAGYFDPPERTGDNLGDQVEASIPVLDDDVDVVIWPEGGSDLDPLRVPAAARVFDEVSRAAGAPLVAGTVTMRGEQYFNTSLVWRDGEGAVDFYDKKHPVPFGEYIPDRAFWRPFAPDLIDLVQREYTPGTTDTVARIGEVLVGLDICFDIVDDRIMRRSVAEGAQVLVAQTNNADFGQTDESRQQLAIARIRAMELGRSLVSVSTVASTAVIRADGSTQAALPDFEPGALVEDVPLSTTTTPAALLGGQLEWLLALGGLGALAVAGVVLRGRRRAG
ncbi:apolipoprotein N-acyltransferase [Homoserinibacter sp. YIM 151385]|uniref:apolipoprotein N-acyltransferase n=1 Tax=Homoserinibacter sp. YIM 151385 TaxID=2985506 RepID=UPI0022F0D558|nr:apolipoprotein N-acyltransferase [Homoserinibacter sp. YIM 151385]WBU38546.1 apolipoprotein N-acyltransferase [Homoserinibacter sp. YIM 151385]